MTKQTAYSQTREFRQPSWRSLLFALRFLRKFVKRLLLVCLLDISISFLGLSIPWFGKLIIDIGFARRDWDLVLRYALGAALLGLLVYGLVALRQFLYNTTEMLLGAEIRRRIYAHIQTLDIDDVESVPVGVRQFRMTTDADRIAHMLVRILPTLTMLVEFALILVAAIYVDPSLTAIVGIFLFPWTILFIWVTVYGRIFDRRRLEFAEQRDSGVLQASASYATIKSLDRIRGERRRHGKANVAVQRVANQGYLILIGFEFVTQQLLPYTKKTTIFLLLAAKVVAGSMTLGMTVPMMAYLIRLTFPIEKIVNFGCWIWQTMVSAERMQQIFMTQPAVAESPNAKRLKDWSGKIDVQNVTMVRAGIGEVLSDVSIAIPPKSYVAIVGPSGAGKSTIIGLIQRMNDPTSGRIEFDGEDLRYLDRTHLMRQIGTVSQSTFIFSGTLEENLRVVGFDGSEEEIWDVLDNVGLGDWARALPNRLAEDLNSGSGLSAGQKQRVGIARALLMNPKVLLLDEPTSALDPETERQIMQTIDNIRADKTVVLITHRLNTVTKADQIFALELGRLVEQGNHEQLLANRGPYATWWNTFHRTDLEQETVNL